MSKAKEILEELNKFNEENNNFEIEDNIAFKANTSFKIGKIINIIKDNLGFTSLKCQYIGDLGTSFNFFEEIKEDNTFFAPPEGVIRLDELKQKADEHLMKVQDTIQRFENFIFGKEK